MAKLCLTLILLASCVDPGSSALPRSGPPRDGREVVTETSPGSWGRRGGFVAGTFEDSDASIPATIEQGAFPVIESAVAETTPTPAQEAPTAIETPSPPRAAAQALTSPGAWPEHRSIGMNLSAPAYYGTTVPWVDVWRQRDRGQTTTTGAWQTNRESSFPIDAQGYPLSAPVNGDMLRYSVFAPVYGGDYVVTWKGTGKVSFPALPGTVTLVEHGAVLRLRASTTEYVFLRIDQSSAADPIKDIHITAPVLSPDGIYNQDFLASLRGYKVIRCMDWLKTNDSQVKTPADLPIEGGIGITYAECLRVAKKIGATAWINIPVMADDAAVTAIGAQLRLISGPRVLVELSNELWNGTFSQGAYARERGLAAGLSDEPTDALLRWQAKRSVEVHTLLYRAINVRAMSVVTGQAANADIPARLVDAFKQYAGKNPNYVAIAPYFGHALNNGYAANTVDQVLLDLEATIPTAMAAARACRAVADARGVPLIAYEAGQHLVAYGPNAAQMTPLFVAANRDPRMGALYRTYLQALLAEFQPLAHVVLFSSCEAPSRFGSWGLIEAQNQPIANSPKAATVAEALGL